MFSLKAIKVFAALNPQMRHLTDGSLIIGKSLKSVKRREVFSLAKKKAAKCKKVSSRKRVPVRKTPVDEFEDVWLESINSGNLKLYRKTSYGSFKKVTLDSLLDKLQILFPNKFGSLSDGVVKVQSGQTSPLLEAPPSNALPQEKSDLASPYMSDYLVKHMMGFPMLKVECKDSLGLLLRNEKENFGTVDSVKYPSVTRVLSDTMSEENRASLFAWRNKMILKLGQEGFTKYQEDLLRNGSKFHSMLKRYFNTGDEKLVTIDPEIEGCWKSLKNILPDISNVLMVEEPVYHPVLMYRGIVDCVASYRDGPCVIEWKKSDKKKPDLKSTYDAPLQLCAYLGALGWRNDKSQIPLKNGLVVTAYTNGAPATIFPMDLECCEFHWNLWLERLQAYWAKRSSTVTQEVSN